MEKKVYIEAVGRRKTAVARVRMTPATKQEIIVNGKEMHEYFKTDELQTIVKSPFVKVTPEGATPDKWKVSVMVEGSGPRGQAEAVRHGISRVFIEHDVTLRGTLKKEGFLKRDARSKERKKFGLKKARKAPQWSKR